MGRRIHDRRTDHSTADEVAEVERHLWEFAKRPDPPGVPEAKLRPGAFLYRVHRVWHSLGRGSGIASHSFRALRDELLQRDPPVRNLQPKLYGTAPLSQADASSLIDVMLETWHVARQKGAGWEATALPLQTEIQEKPADANDLDAIRENLLHTLFKGEDTLLLEEPVGVPPEIFFEERGRSSLALIIPTKGETAAHLSPSNTYGGFSNLVGQFFEAAAQRYAEGQSLPLLIWVLRLRGIRETSEFHQAFHSLAAYSACLTNWYFRLSRKRGAERKRAQDIWDMIIRHGAFAVHGLPKWVTGVDPRGGAIDEDLIDVEPSYFLPTSLPIVLNNHRLVRRHRDQNFGLNVSIEPDSESARPKGGRLNYWLFPDRPGGDHEETADTTGLPVFNAETSPGPDYDLAYGAIYEAVMFHLRFSDDDRSRLSFNTLLEMGWHVLSIMEFQKILLVSSDLDKDSF